MIEDIHRSKTLDCFIGQIVKITFYDGKIAIGKLGYCDKFDPRDPHPVHYYYVRGFFCGWLFFRKSHVKKIELEAAL